MLYFLEAGAATRLQDRKASSASSLLADSEELPLPVASPSQSSTKEGVSALSRFAFENRRPELLLSGCLQFLALAKSDLWQSPLLMAFRRESRRKKMRARSPEELGPFGTQSKELFRHL